MFERSLLAMALVLLLVGTTVAAPPAAVWLTAEDGVEVRGDLYALDGEGARERPCVLLFHQAGSNRTEYASIGPRLNKLGLNALAIDQRSGGERWGSKNETVDKLGESTGYLEALPDLEAALRWTQEAGYDGPTIVWGSSYSAALVFLLAAEHGDRIDGILSFSPGEYLGSRSGEVSKAAANVTVPTLILTPGNERSRAEPILRALSGEHKDLVIPERAVHGSSMLMADSNEGASEIWPRVEAFLVQFGSAAAPSR